MTMTATYIGQSTVQISTVYATNMLGTSTLTASSMTPFMTFANTVADAITGTQSGASGTLGGVTFAAASGVTPQTSSGWTLYDSFWGCGVSSPANSTASPIYTQVFRALNADGVTYKFILLRYHTNKQEINTTTVSAWNNSLHTGTAEAWTYYDCSPVAYNLTTCDFVVMVQPQWCVLHSYISGEPSLWSGVFEMAREDINDTAANNNPCWGWIGSTLWMLGCNSINVPANANLNGNGSTLICMPSTKNGYTGYAAASSWGADYGFTSHPNWLTSPATPFISYLGYLGSSGSVNRFGTTAWDTTKRLALPIKPINDFKSANLLTTVNYGQIFGLKVTSAYGNNMNKISLNVDTTGNSSNTGTARNHWILNVHWKSPNDTASWWGNPNWTMTSLSIGTGYRPEYMVSTGNAYYVICNNGAYVYQIDAASTTTTPIFTSGGTYTDIKYDGERFVYITSTSTVASLIRLDTAGDVTQASNQATALPNATAGLSTLAINGTHVIVTTNTANASPTVYRYTRQASTGTINPITLDGTIGSVVLNSFIENVTIRDIVSDYDGNFWMVAPINTTVTNYKLTQISAAGTASYCTTNINQAICANVSLQMLDGNNMLQWQDVTSSTNYMTVLNPRNSVSSAVTISAVTGASNNVLTANLKSFNEKIHGVVLHIPRNSGVNTNVSQRTRLGGTATANALLLDTTSVVAATAAGPSNQALTTCTANAFVYSDGARIFSNSDSGLRIFSNVTGQTTIGGTVYNNGTYFGMGMVAIPA